MPINPNALSSPQLSSEQSAAIAAHETAVAQQSQDAVAPDGTELGQSGGAAEVKPRRRNRAQMIADAEVPADDALVTIKDAGTGAKVERPWLEAVQLVADNKAEWADKAMRYAVMKMEQQRAAPAFEENDPNNPYLARTDQPNVFEQPVAPSENPADREVRYTVSGQALLGVAGVVSPEVVSWTDDANGSGTMTIGEWNLLSMSPPPDGGVPSNVPPEAEVGDEVRVGAETLRVGHGRVLTGSPVAIDGEAVQPKRRWQRELGSGPNGPWEATVLMTQAEEDAFVAGGPESPKETMLSNGNGDSSKVVRPEEGAPPVTVETEKLPHESEKVDVNVWRISTGILEKIGMPDYSSFQIGPINVNRFVLDDGRRTTVNLANGRQGTIPTSIIEAFEEADNTVEFMAARFRGQLKSFFEATGALNQPSA